MRKVSSNLNVVHDCVYHVVWCPKYRRRVLTSDDTRLDNPPIDGDPGAIDARLIEIIREVCDENYAEVVEVEVMPDHVHLVVRVDPQFGIARIIRLVKGRTSRVLREEFPSLRRRLPTLWTNSYFVATTGGAPLEAIKKYVENQRGV